MNNILAKKSLEELMAMKKHDRVIYIYELLTGYEVHVMGDGRLFQQRNGIIEQVKYGDMLKLYNNGSKIKD